ncbi:6-O-methylguanine DNA methyltransferase [Dimargaris cristalligena]|uniref:Methylated-DNA--protein-cysteine methyltransferase n=1 Tax=Dimargaris cristalligena TaxID=215637 RepID=A0A4P9ZNW9_9FUNG|nr:6-O-methylguanine DNA methyltransferase [Dimargaris cristalligena]|eukprot:RKP35003.1 6-O-methylguanine DNA methyltransferase [Dimargaris cristalligena]
MSLARAFPPAVKYFPTQSGERSDFINSKTSRRVTEFQFRVYDLCAQIPAGRISTYKMISDALKSSPRAVGQALRNNPFDPLPVPCHRVLASDLYLGGFSGDWGCGKVSNKRSLLNSEGIDLDENDYVVVDKRSQYLFNDFVVPI